MTVATGAIVIPKSLRGPASLRDLRMSGLLLVAIGLALASLHTLLSDVDWWFSAMVIALLVLGSSAAARYYLRWRWIGTPLGLVVGILALTAIFTNGDAILGFIPGPAAADRFGTLAHSGLSSISAQGVPATAIPGIQLLICAAIAAIAVFLDAVVIWARAPALAGIGLLVIILVPSIVDATLADPLFFELAAVAYLLIIRDRVRRIQPGVAVALGAIAVLGALLVPNILPAVSPGSATGTGIGTITEAINPIVSLGDDLRQTKKTPALSYTTTSATGQYLRVATLDNFDGPEWSPVIPHRNPANTVARIGAPAGLTVAVSQKKVTTRVRIEDTTGQWLPVPYPSTRITGLTGQWFWEPRALEVRSNSSDMRGQRYTVTSLDVEPTSTQLAAAPRSASSPQAEVPKGLNPIVAETARKVVGGATTDFAKALALQAWFQSGAFTYSVKAPAAANYDGSGLDVIVPFLKAKKGYCIHFATTMAVMARTLGIPSRIAVGFLPGRTTTVKGSSTLRYQVESTDLHAWPELYFAGTGWVRFEPTPTRGFEPNFPAVAQPAGGSTSAPATPSPTGSTPTAAPAAPKRLVTDAPQAGSSVNDTARVTATNWALVALLVVLGLLGAPGVARTAIRRRRVDEVRLGNRAARTSWLELRDTVRDLGLQQSATTTPRELAVSLTEYLRAGLEPGGVALESALSALGELRDLVEEESFRTTEGRFQGDRMADALVAVLRGLRAATPAGHRVRAAVLPATIIDRIAGRGAVRA